MKAFFYLLYLLEPFLLIFGLLGLFGDEAQEAAEEVATGVGVLIAIILAVVLCFYLIYLATGWTPIG